MNKFLLSIAAILLFTSASFAQTTMTAEQYETRYNALVKNLGPSGVGIETLLNRWEKAFPEDPAQQIARFSFYFAKSQSVEMVKKDAATFLGEKPSLSLKDSLGAPVNYFQEIIYDDELFGQASQAIDKAIQLCSNRLDYRFCRISALISYEKESPDIAKADLKSLIDYNFTQKPEWVYPDVEADSEFFNAVVQEYCYMFFKMSVPGGYEAFRDLSLAVLKYEPNNTLFLNNLGSYYLVAKKDHKTALKYYNKVLKLDKTDMTAIKNGVLLARNQGNLKLEKKFLGMMASYGEGGDKLSAQSRLESLNKK